MKTFILSGGLTITACTSMYGTPEQRQQHIVASSDYILCENLALATLAPAEIRNEWAKELQRRGTDCDKYANTIHTVAQQRQRALDSTTQPPQQPKPITPTTTEKTCFKKREWVSGFNKNCVYDCVGSEAVETISNVALCPLTVEH